MGTITAAFDKLSKVHIPHKILMFQWYADKTALGCLDEFLISELAREDEPVLPFSYFPISYAYQASLSKGTGVS